MDGVPRWKGTTLAAALVADPPSAIGCTITSLAVMVVRLAVPKLTLPSTMTLSPFVIALAEIELVPFRYVVEDVVSMVTITFAGVEITMLDGDTLFTVPAVPPSAGPERGP